MSLKSEVRLGLFLALVLFLASLAAGSMQIDYVWDIWDIAFGICWTTIFSICVGIIDRYMRIY